RPTYEIQRAALQSFLDELNGVEKTLRSMRDDEVKIRLDLEKIRLDFRSTAGVSMTEEAQDPTTLMAIIRSMNGVVARTAAPPAAASVPFEVAFDRADALWLQGYCHLLAAGLEFVLAYDWQDSFEKAGGLFYKRLELPGQTVGERNFFGDQNTFA